MRIKLDENTPARLVPLLMDLGHDVDTVVGEKLVGRDDLAIWEGSQAPYCVFVVAFIFSSQSSITAERNGF